MKTLHAYLGSVENETTVGNLKLINCKMCLEKRNAPCLSEDKQCCLGTVVNCNNKCPNKT